MHLHIVVPELFWPAADPASAHHGLDLPSIELLIARGRKSVHPCAGAEAWLLDTFGVERDGHLPAAPFALLGEGVAPDAHTWWLADPVHLKLGRDDFTLVDGPRQLPISREEADALVAALDAHFGSEGIAFVAPRPDRWYVRTPPTEDTCVTTPIAAVRGRMIDPFLPTGPGARTLRRILNDAQMLLFEHPVNVRREASGQLPVNSVWPWGGGHLTAPAHVRMSSIHADLMLARGIAVAAGITSAALPADLVQFLGSTPAGQVPCIVLDDMRGLSAAGERDAWRTALARLETAWFGPALAALRGRRIGMVTVHVFGPASELRVETTGADLRYLWRRRRPLASYIRAPGERDEDGAAA